MKTQLEKDSLGVTKDGITIVLQVPSMVYSKLHSYSNEIKALRKLYDSVVIIEVDKTLQLTTHSK